jgi:hypothetical protein
MITALSLHNKIKLHKPYTLAGLEPENCCSVGVRFYEILDFTNKTDYATKLFFSCKNEYYRM